MTRLTNVCDCHSRSMHWGQTREKERSLLSIMQVVLPKKVSIIKTFDWCVSTTIFEKTINTDNKMWKVSPGVCRMSEFCWLVFRLNVVQQPCCSNFFRFSLCRHICIAIDKIKNAPRDWWGKLATRNSKERNEVKLFLQKHEPLKISHFGTFKTLQCSC